MENALSKYEENAYISRFREEDSIKITKEQFTALEGQLAKSDVRFVRIGNKIINVNDIKEVGLIPKKPDTRFDDNSSNTLYRNWVMAGREENFAEWVNKQTKEE